MFFRHQYTKLRLLYTFTSLSDYSDLPWRFYTSAKNLALLRRKGAIWHKSSPCWNGAWKNSGVEGLFWWTFAAPSGRHSSITADRHLYILAGCKPSLPTPFGYMLWLLVLVPPPYHLTLLFTEYKQTLTMPTNRHNKGLLCTECNWPSLHPHTRLSRGGSPFSFIFMLPWLPPSIRKSVLLCFMILLI